MKLLLATDAWQPQVNGVVRTLGKMVDGLRAMGHQVEVVATGDYPSVPLPSYAEIEVSVWLRGLGERIRAFDPDAVHIATEGPIGLYVRRYCLRQGYTFTTSFHTRFPEYIRDRLPIPLSVTYPPIRRFHKPAFRTLVPTPALKADLETRGFEHLEVWGRGVDTAMFTPDRRVPQDLPRPIHLNVGRIAPEKNLHAFLELDLPGTRVVVGDGPRLAQLKKQYPDVVFPGFKHGTELAAWYASADVFVFPSLTDTFGLVMLESLACGTPVAAFPVTGPLDVIDNGVTGILDDDLGSAIAGALDLDRDVCRNAALSRDWASITHQFLQALMPVNSDKACAWREGRWASQVTPA
ncbi:MAG: glycosyltransferase family 1 protein [Chromatiaceae bacterium]|nr:glycosyltransferase family 1 protein [Chromatiaceae bacterium]